MLVDVAKSSRLVSIRAKVEKQSSNIKSQDRQFSSELKLEYKVVLEHAVKLIEQRLAEILNSYPVVKKNTFFKIKHGIKLDEIYKMPMKQVFLLLHLKTSSIHNFHLIENLNFSGKTVE